MRALLFWLRFGPYTAATTALLPFAALLFAAHPNLRGRLGDRLGFPAVRPPTPGRPRVVFHGASYGDVKTLEPVAAALARSSPSCEVVLSTMTASGARRAAGSGLASVRLPAENLFCAMLWLRRLRPSCVVFEYLELWPSVLVACRVLGVPVVCHNVHVNERSVSGLRVGRALLGDFLADVRVYLAQSPLDRWRLRRAGADDARIRVTGDTKRLDADDASALRGAKQLAASLHLRRGDPRVVFGSYQPGEEDLLLGWLPSLLAALPRCQFVLAARYPHRDAAFLPRLRRVVPDSQLRSSGRGRARVLLLDSMGELAAVYHLAQVAVVMGSFVSRGGQNPLEPARAGIPVLFGPSMQNFRDEVKLLDGAGAETVASPEALVPRVAALVRDKAERRRRGLLALACVQHLAQRGRSAVQQNAQSIHGVATQQSGDA